MTREAREDRPMLVYSRGGISMPQRTDLASIKATSAVSWLANVSAAACSPALKICPVTPPADSFLTKPIRPMKQIHYSRLLTPVQLATVPRDSRLIKAHQEGSSILMTFAPCGDTDEPWTITADLAGTDFEEAVCLGAANAARLWFRLPTAAPALA